MSPLASCSPAVVEPTEQQGREIVAGLHRRDAGDRCDGDGHRRSSARTVRCQAARLGGAGHQRVGDHRSHAERGDARRERGVAAVDDEDVDAVAVQACDADGRHFVPESLQHAVQRSLDRCAGDDRADGGDRAHAWCAAPGACPRSARIGPMLTNGLLGGMMTKSAWRSAATRAGRRARLPGAAQRDARARGRGRGRARDTAGRAGDRARRPPRRCAPVRRSSAARVTRTP